jgi:hypothetical protein
MFRFLTLLAPCVTLALTLGACGGIPLSSMPRLMALQHTLLEIDPAEFRLAIQVDARVAPPPDAAPAMHLAIRPREAGAFAAVEKTLPMRFMDAGRAPRDAKGLAPAPAGRRWLIYRFPPPSQTELADLQRQFKRLQARQQGKGGGSVAVGIAQEGIAAGDPALAGTRWESWLQTAAREGYYELWSGTIAQLLQQARRKAK